VRAYRCRQRPYYGFAWIICFLAALIVSFSDLGLGGDGDDLHLKLEHDVTPHIGNLLTIQNVGNKPITIQKLLVNDRSDCSVSRFILGLGPNTPMGETPTLNIGDGAAWTSNCNIVRVTVESDRGSATYFFED
jgi:hypothetical protein